MYDIIDNEAFNVDENEVEEKLNNIKSISKKFNINCTGITERLEEKLFELENKNSEYHGEEDDRPIQITSFRK